MVQWPCVTAYSPYTVKEGVAPDRGKKDRVGRKNLTRMHGWGGCLGWGL